VEFAAALGGDLHTTTFAVDIPPLRSPLGRLLVDIPSLAKDAEERSLAECARLQNLVSTAAGARIPVDCTTARIVLGGAADAAAAEARCHGLSLLPWCADVPTAQEMAQAVVFGSGRPAILVPPTARPARLEHVAIAWDASRVAARALWDALALLAEDGRVTVMTIRDEKPLHDPDLAAKLAAMLDARGYAASPLDIALGDTTIAAALQDAAVQAGAQLLAMGGFGHSRLRDFILGGATQGVFRDLRLPVLLSH
jgi:nucleotide-binding universal stress UspA family protein